MKDATFTSIAQRAAQYPIVMRKGQMAGVRVSEHYSSEGHTETFRRLLLNTREVNRMLQHASPRST